MKSKFEYSGLTKDVESIARKVFEPLNWMIPGWCHHIIIEFNDSPDDIHKDSACYVKLSPDYRWCKIVLLGPWLSGSDAARREYSRHEMFHVILAPYSEFCREIINSLTSEEPEGVELARQASRFLEGAIQDLTYLKGP